METGDILNHNYRIENLLVKHLGHDDYLATNIHDNSLVIIEHYENVNNSSPNIINDINYQIQLGKTLHGPYFMDFIDCFTIQSDMLVVWKHKDTQPITKNNSLKSLSELEVCKFIAQCIHAIHSAHEFGIIHGALSSDVILITTSLTPVITGFSTPGAAMSTDPGIKDGVSAYRCAAPELFQGTSIDESCDFYSIGVIGNYLFSVCSQGSLNNNYSLEKAKRLISLLTSTERSTRVLAAEHIRDSTFLDELTTPARGNEVIVLSRRQIRSIKRNHTNTIFDIEKRRNLIGFSIRLIIILAVIFFSILILSQFIHL